MEILNSKLPFTPKCPKCGAYIVIERSESGFYAKCKKCGDEWASSRFSEPHMEVEWLEKFHDSGQGKEGAPAERPATPPDPPPHSDVKIFMEIAHSSEKLKKAYDLVCQAYDLINEDKVARRYIKFNAKVTWMQFVWDILNKQYDEDKPGNKDVYHLRAFDFYGVQPGMLVGDGEVEGN